MKKFIALATVVALFVSSCAKNEISQNVSEGNKISFSTYTGIATKGQVYTSTNLEDGFGVIAYNTGAATDFNTNSSVINFMYDTKVYYSSEAWTYSPTKYWSSDASTQYSFFGYAPYESGSDDTGITLCANTDVGTPYLDFAIADDAVDMVDFTASQVMNTTKTESSDAVQMYFKHQLTRVTFKAKSCVDEETPGYEDIFVNVTGFRILGSAPTDGTTSYVSGFGSSALYSAATYTFDATTTTDNDEEVHTQDGVWSSYTTITEGYDLSSIFADESVYEAIGAVEDSGYETYYTNENGVLLAGGADAVSLFDENEYLFLIPPYGATGLDSDAGYNIQIEVVYDIITKDASLACGFVVSSENNIAIVDLTEETLKQGHAYEYLLTITGASFSDPTEDDIDPDDPDEEAFDAIVITGSVCDWDTSEELGYEAEDTGWDISLETADDSSALE